VGCRLVSITTNMQTRMHNICGNFLGHEYKVLGTSTVHQQIKVYRYSFLIFFYKLTIIFYEKNSSLLTFIF